MVRRLDNAGNTPRKKAYPYLRHGLITSFRMPTIKNRSTLCCRKTSTTNHTKRHSTSHSTMQVSKYIFKSYNLITLPASLKNIYNFLPSHYQHYIFHLTSLVQPERHNMRIDHTQIKRRKEHILIRQRNKRRPVHRRVSLIHLARRLIRVSRVIPRGHKRRVREVQLRDPRHELR